MKTSSSSAERSVLPREFGILDTLVLMLAAGLFAAWILGTIFLSIYPAGAGTGAESQNVAITGSADGSAGDAIAANTGGASDGTAAGNEAGDPNRANAAGAVSNLNQVNAGGDFSSKEKGELERKISNLQKQLDTKSKELTQLRKTKTESAKSNPAAAVDTEKFEKEIAKLKKERGFLDQRIKRLDDLSDKQKMEIKELKDQLANAAEAEPMAETPAEDIATLNSVSPTDQPLEFRDWISSKGNKARLAFVRWEDDEIVVVNESNKAFRLTLNRLSPEDQQYVNSKR